MMSRRGFCFDAGAFALGGGSLPGERRPAGEVMVAIANNVYANLHDGQPTGIVIEAIDAILRAMGRKPAYIAIPDADMAAELAKGTVGVNPLVVRPASGRDFALLSDPILTDFNVVAILADSALPLATLSDLYGLTLGGRDGVPYPMLEADPRIKLERFARDSELIRRLLHRRIDAAIISAISDLYELRAEGLMSRIKVLDLAVGAIPLSAELSAKLFNVEDLITFNRLLASLEAGPVWSGILERNGLADLVVEWPMIQP